MRRCVLSLPAILGLACAALAVETAKTTLCIKGMTSDERAAAVERHLKQAAGAGLDGKPLHVCCEGCLRYFQANREKVLALRGLAPRG